MNMRLMLALCIGACLAMPVFAQETNPSDGDKPKTEETTVTQPGTPQTEPPQTRPENKGTESQISKLASKYNVPPEEIQALRDKKMGWGEIGHALAISQKAGVPLSEVMKLRESGMGWGNISKKYNLKLGEVTRQAKEVAREGKLAEHHERNRDRGPAFDRPGRGQSGMERGPRGGHEGHGKGNKH